MQAPTGNSTSTAEEDVQSHVKAVSPTLPVTVQAKSRQNSKRCGAASIIENMKDGWPLGSCPLLYDVRGELNVIAGLLLKQNTKM